MIQEWVWQLDPPTGWDVDSACQAILAPVGDLLKLNPWVTNAEVTLEEDHLLLAMSMKGHDRWWVRKRAPYLIASVAARSRFPISRVSHIAIRTPETKKNARFRDEEGRRVFVPVDGSEVEVQVTARGCINCKDPAHWLWRRGWKTGPKAAHPGRGH